MGLIQARQGRSPALCAALAVSLLVHCTVANWWQLGLSTPFMGVVDLSPVGNHKDNCHRLEFLVDRQKYLCSVNERILGTVSLGARLAIEECQHQFRHSRWNCSIVHRPTAAALAASSGITGVDSNVTNTNALSNVFGGVLTIKSRESAYIYAISAASVAFAVTRACSRGELTDCACDNRVRKKPRTWQWGGCSEDILFGEQFSRDFVDSIEDRSSAAGLMDIHNNEAGRRAIRSRMQRVCKCHGMSGSCSVRVCWRRLPPMRTVGEALGARYEGASHVKVVERGLKTGRGGRGGGAKGGAARAMLTTGRDEGKVIRKLRPLSRELKKPNKTDLVYLDDSPDYCESNELLDIHGTRGRVCNRTSHGLDGCRLLCCGRGYQTRVREVVEKCRCKFVWCCNVQCDLCKYRREEHVCN